VNRYLRSSGSRYWRTFAAALAIALSNTACSEDADDPLGGRGTVEHLEVDVAPLVTARVVTVRAAEGDRVSVGDTLLALTQTTEQAEVEGRRARLAAAEAQLRDLELGARPAEIDRLSAELRSAEAEVTRTSIDSRRADSLLAGGNITAQQQEAARAAAATAAARRDAVRESLRLMRQGARPQQVTAARAEVEAARASLRAAERSAAELVLTAPIAGVIVSRHAEPGEVVAAGRSAMTIADPERPWVRLYLGPRAIPLVKIGDSATAVLDAFPGSPVTGRIVAISPRAEFTPRVALTEEERADMLFGIRIDFHDTSGMLKAGLPVRVRVHASHAPRSGER
jgi:HlyD family secretion protein